MKRVFSLLALIGIFWASNCSRIPDNTDPVLGYWSTEATATLKSSESTQLKKEWVFNDVYLGRYTEFESNTIAVDHDFRWRLENGAYILSYPEQPDVLKVYLVSEEGVQTLQNEEGDILAIRQ
jgi:hypothetical protein